MSNFAQLKTIFVNALGINASIVTDELAYASISQWDSVAHMGLVAALEEAFDIMLDTDDIIDMSSVAKVRQILGKYDVNC
jgi:acyl carrier protein